MEQITKYLLIGVLLLAGLILCVQIITEILKGAIKDKSKITWLVLAVSLVLTIILVIALSQIIGFALAWYMVAGAIVLSFFVAYGAMLGYDKLFRRVFEAVKQAINIFLEIKKEVPKDEKDIE